MTSKNDDPNGCPDQVMGDCVYACVYCGKDADAEHDGNLSAAIRALLAEALTARAPKNADQETR